MTYHNMRSPTVRRFRIGCGVFGFLVLSILPLLVLVTTDGPLLETATAIWPLLLGPLLFPFILIPLYKSSVRRTAARMVTERESAGAFGSCSLSIGPDGIVETKANGQSIRKWDYVNRLCLTPHHIFVYTSSIEAFILPKRAFEDDRHSREFVDQIAKYAGVTPES
ncbi:MAG: YcxB family protein [Pirellulaceae bacterium]|nr:YcxB family protein [Pirellulaceae bacterium]